MKDEPTTNQPTLPPIRWTAHEVFRCLTLDVWPGPAAITDFGLRSDDHYGALQYAIRHHDAGPRELDDALGSGAALTALIREDNPYHGVTFSTPWDDVMVKVDHQPPRASGEKFPPGRLFATSLALKTLARDGIVRALDRHHWGNVTAEDRAMNERGLSGSGMLLSVYRTTDGKEYWVLTEADRSVTVVLMPGEL